MKEAFVIFFFLNFCSCVHEVFGQQMFQYAWPENLASAKDFEVYINDEKQFVYNTASAAFICFPLKGEAQIRIVYGGTIYSHDIRPLRLGVTSKVYRDEIHLKLNQPTKLSVEINKNIKRPLLIFADPPAGNIPVANANTFVFKAGKVHDIGTIRLNSNQTIYIEGGAVVKGSIIADKCANVKILGYGVLDNNHYAAGEARPIEINQSNNVLIEGIVIADSKHWTCGSYASTNVTYRGLKIVSDNNWDDGIDIVGSRRVDVDNCFIKTKDDCIAIKAGVSYFQKFETGLTVNEVTIRNSTFWNGVWGNALEIGFETRTDTIQNVTFSNLDIIHTEGPEGTFTIHNGDRALIRNIRYENIYVEDARGYLIDFKILDSRYTKDKQKGFIRDVTFKNINVEGDIFPTSVIMGFSDVNNIKGISLENVVIHGRKVTSTYSGMITTIHATDIVYKR